MSNDNNEEVIPQDNANDNKPAFLDKPEAEWTTDDVAEAKKSIKTLHAQKEHWRGKANGPKDPPAAAAEPKPLQTEANADSAWREKIELKTEGYSDDEVAFIQQNGGRKALDNPFVKQAIESIRTQRKAEGAVIDTDTNKSEVERKYTPQQLSEMPLADLEKILPRAS